MEIDIMDDYEGFWCTQVFTTSIYGWDCTWPAWDLLGIGIAPCVGSIRAPGNGHGTGYWGEFLRMVYSATLDAKIEPPHARYMESDSSPIYSGEARQLNEYRYR
jgi:hypothetical protein